MSAPSCGFPGCGNSTWNPGGMCHLHVNATPTVGAGNQAFTGGIPPHMSQSYSQSEVDQIITDVENVFPDIEEVTPQSIRHQAVATITAAVGIEMYRALPSVDGTPPEQRDHMLSEWHNYIVRSARPINNPMIDVDDASALADSSVDEYGRGFQESCELTSYALTKEWELAQATGTKVDEYGREYGNNVDNYIARITPVITMNASNEYYGQLRNYNKVVTEATGQQPRTIAPPDHIIPRSRLDLLTNEEIVAAYNGGHLAPEEEVIMHGRIAAERQQIADQQAQQRRAETNKKLIGTAMGVAGMAAAMLAPRQRPAARQPAARGENIIERTKRENEEYQNRQIRRAAYQRSTNQLPWYRR